MKILKRLYQLAILTNLTTIIKLIIPPAIFFLIFTEIDVQQLSSTLKSSNLTLISTALLFGLIGMFGGGLRWLWILNRLGICPNAGKGLKLQFQAFAFGMVMPGNVGGDIFKILTLKSWDHPILESLMSVAIDRYSNLQTLLTLSAVIALSHGSLRDDISLAVLLTTLGFSVLPYAVLFIAGKIKVDFYLFSRHASQAIVFIAVFFLNLKRYIFLMSGAAAQNLVYLIFTYFLVTACTSTDDPWLISVVILFTANVATFVPISIGGFGIREGGIVLLLTQLAVDLEEAVAVSMAFSGALIVFCLLGLLPLGVNASHASLKS